MDPLAKRRDELEQTARHRGIKVDEALKTAGLDNVVAIGILAKLLGIDAMTALNTTEFGAPLTRNRENG